MNRPLTLASITLLLVIGLILARQAALPAPKSLTPTLTNQPELCLTCHDGIEEISAAHPTEAFGCVLCHGGNALALDKDLAHAGLRGGQNPGDFSVVETSCGGSQCHAGSIDDQRDHIHRSLTSIQATYAGAIAQVRRSFGAQPDGTPHFGVSAIADDTVVSSQAVPALAMFQPRLSGDPEPVIKFFDNCLTCHLSAQPVMQPYQYRGTGCSACHTPYSSDGLYRGSDPTLDKTQAGYPTQHRLTIKMPYTTCNTCHNRGNYSLRQMTFLPRPDLPTTGAPLPEDRLRDYYQPIGQFTLCEWKLDCIDCHTSTEARGDGDLYGSKFDIQYTRCKTCHGTLDDLPRTIKLTNPNDVEFRRAQLNGNYSLQVGDTVLLTERNEKFGSIKLVDGKYLQTLKVSGEVYEIPLVKGTACLQQPDQQESRYCHECHAVER